MLQWSEAEIANTVLHEMTHATLWVKGSVALNESFASFVGDVASLRYLVSRHGLHSQAVLDTVNRREDIELWRALQKTLYGDLTALFGSPTLGEEAMLTGKRLLYADFVLKVADAPFHDPEPFEKAAREGTWNNARMVQFRTYNSEKHWFAILLDAQSGDLAAFIQGVGAIVEDAEDPFQALAAAAGVQDF
jgi:predicted aminopeptidase